VVVCLSAERVGVGALVAIFIVAEAMGFGLAVDGCQGSQSRTVELDQACLLRSDAIIDLELTVGRPAIAVRIKNRLNLNAPFAGGMAGRRVPAASLNDAIVNPVPPARGNVTALSPRPMQW